MSSPPKPAQVGRAPQLRIEPMRFWSLLILVCATFSLGSTRAFAADVVLVHPAGADPFIEETYHRVRGELRAQAIAFEQEEGGANDLSGPASQALLGRGAARACISFNWHGEATVIRVWVIEAVGKPPNLSEAVALERNDEAPTLLAARAVDLLSSALRRAERSAPSQKRLIPRPARESPGRSGPWLIGGGMSGINFPTGVGFAFGPQVSVVRRVSAGLGLVMHASAPLLGARVENSEASARLVQGLAVLGLEAELLRLGPIGLSLDGGLGVHFLRAAGSVAEGIGSLAARRERRLTLGLVAGAEGSLELSSRLSLVLGASALLLLPPLQIALGRETIHLNEPGIQWCGGLRFAL